MTKHRLRISFNDPPEAYNAEITVHFLGPYTDKFDAAADEYIKEARPELPLGTKHLNIFFTASIAMKPGNLALYEGYCKRLTDLFNENKPKPSSYVPNMSLKLYAEDNKINAKFLLTLPGGINPFKSF